MGRVLQVDSPSDLYERPRSRRVAAFIGKTNLLDARVVSRDDDQATIEVETLGRLAFPASAVQASAGRAALRIHPPGEVRDPRFTARQWPPSSDGRGGRGESIWANEAI
jgi:ABC-type Fe3+/spermidine/putrescine transport system ATPase subunit